MGKGAANNLHSSRRLAAIGRLNFDLTADPSSGSSTSKLRSPLSTPSSEGAGAGKRRRGSRGNATTSRRKQQINHRHVFNINININIKSAQQ